MEEVILIFTEDKAVKLASLGGGVQRKETKEGLSTFLRG